MLVCALLGACQSPRGTHDGGGESLREVLAPPMPPAYLHTPWERQAYLVRHYWDDIDLSSRALLADKALLRDLLGDYCGLLTSLEIETYRLAWLLPLERAQGDMLTSILDLYRQHLYAPGSPLLNEEAYSLILEWAIASPKVPAPQQAEARELLTYIGKNKVGNTATDFIYMTAEGTLRRLSRVRTPYTILAFGKQGESSTRTLIEAIRHDRHYTDLADVRAITLLCIYLDAQEAHPVAEIDTLKGWIETGRDHEGAIRRDSLYALRSLPTLYLLGKDKEVLLKDTSLETLTQYIKRIPLPEGKQRVVERDSSRKPAVDSLMKRIVPAQSRVMGTDWQ